MANIKSAKKRIAQTAKRTIRNKDRLSRVRGYTRKFMEAVAANENIDSAFQNAMREYHKGAQKGVINKKTASRKIARMYKFMQKAKQA